MTKEEISQFFECLGEIWRDITTIEFFMRCSIAKKEGDITKLPKPPYTKGKVYTEYPNSFKKCSFEELVNQFNTHFSENIKIPKEFMDLRHAMAHGMIIKINGSDVNEIVKFKELKNQKGLEVEFHMSLELEKLKNIRKSLQDIRMHLGQLAND